MSARGAVTRARYDRNAHARHSQLTSAAPGTRPPSASLRLHVRHLDLRSVSSRLRLHVRDLTSDQYPLAFDSTFTSTATISSITSSPPSPFPAPGRRTARVRPRAKMSTEHFPSTRTSWTPPGVINFRSFPRGVLPQGSMWNSATTRTGGRILFGHRAVWWPTPTWKAANSASLGPPKRSFRCEEPTQVVQPAAVAQPAEIANHHGGRGIVEPVNGTRRLRQEQPALVRGRCRRCGLR